MTAKVQSTFINKEVCWVWEKLYIEDKQNHYIFQWKNFSKRDELTCIIIVENIFGKIMNFLFFFFRISYRLHPVWIATFNLLRFVCNTSFSFCIQVWQLIENRLKILQSHLRGKSFLFIFSENYLKILKMNSFSGHRFFFLMNSYLQETRNLIFVTLRYHKISTLRIN